MMSSSLNKSLNLDMNMNTNLLTCLCIKQTQARLHFGAPLTKTHRYTQHRLYKRHAS